MLISLQNISEASQQNSVAAFSVTSEVAGDFVSEQKKHLMFSYSFSLFSLIDSIRLVNGNSLCSGRLEVKSNQRWSSVCEDDFDQQDAEVVCRELGCGAPSVLQGALYGEVEAPVWTSEFQCGGHESALLDCRTSGSDRNTCSPGKAVGLTCSDSVRLVNGNSLCSGRLEVKSNQRWSSVCEDDFDQQDAEVVCRELGCGAPSVLQGALYGEVEAPMWTREFQCGGHESALLDCRTSGSDRNTCSPGKAVGLTCSERDIFWLVGGSSRCAGELELRQQGVWRKVDEAMLQWNLKTADAVCRHLDCGSAVSTGQIQSLTSIPVWRISSTCLQSGSAISDCVSTTTDSAKYHLEVKCSDSVRLVNGNSLCSGRLEVKSNQRWSSVCEDDFDQQDAEVVCRELGCGAPSVLQGALYGEVEAPMWTSEFQCGGHESALLDCRTSGSDRNTCSPGKAVGLTCSEPDIFQLVGGSSRCAGEIEVKQHGIWRKVHDASAQWNLKTADAVCRQLDCGSAVSTGLIQSLTSIPVWRISSTCLQSGSAISDCVSTKTDTIISHLEVKCSDSVRLVNGNSLCSGRLEVKSNQRWSSVCEDDFDQQDAEVVCRELGCGAPSVLQGALYGEVEAPVWTREFQCGGHESALLDCRTSGSDRNTCSPGKAVGLTCSDSVRLVNGNSLCSGRLEVKSNQRWSSVCEDDFDQQDAEVVCRELGCGAPSVLQGALYGEVEAPMWTSEFQCGGHESALLDCRTSGSDRNTCSPGKAVGLTCSEPDIVRLSGGTSRCDGTLEMKQRGEWRPVANMFSEWDQKLASVACRQFNCGSVVSKKTRETLYKPAWQISETCVQSDSIPLLRECLITPGGLQLPISLEVICSDILAQPNISFSPHNDGLSEDKQLQVLLGSSFTISCSILPQHPGGSFQLILTNSATSQNYTLPAVNHSAHFLFSAADHTHQGNYICVYHVYAFFHKFSPESRRLYVTVAASLTDLIIRLALIVLMVAFSAAMFFYYKVSNSQMPRREDNIELDYLGGAQDGNSGAEEAGVEGPQ
ncbi:scavenger receptor cysteine-rich type 1 protein M130-like isoform X4 [Acanthopagrus latus]|uniref:scavenger receptor cysteine-rich type 1 protein M130-like isoform X4 n=1 Tax=Acanthopagrus latus TaxID=8177 RepID=UPI00187C99DC|nr:scavenger receptor cysteine-rich type 1 protein M130-like isoform X4 [Acanthopagrus latus]